jgi:hypothetical protein
MMSVNLMELASHALRERAVASQGLENGLHVLVYPAESAILIAFGYKADKVRRGVLSAALHRRAGDVARFGQWMPALMADGAFYVVRRVRSFEPHDGLPLLSEGDMNDAQELIS